MALEVYWGSGSPYAWRALLALEFKHLTYVSHILDFSKQEHKSPQMLKMNPRARTPVVQDGDYVAFESLAILFYLDRKHPEPPLFGATAEEGGTIMRVISEFQAYIEGHLMKIVEAILFQGIEGRMDELSRALLVVEKEAKAIDARLLKSEWLVGSACSAADIMVFPPIKLLLRALGRPQAQDIRTRLLPLETHYPGIDAWLKRMETLPGYDRTYPPHWRE
ncbi:MAG TPA: glutathione S-transferase family protein [Steroidobacteraceae bacterium]|nr:glutathione S-transferase family protein [Steroidobacteraceae bacterium]